MSQATILVIDDDPQFVDLLRLQLQASGYTILAAHDGMQGLELAKSERPDLVILDVMMPHMDGYDVCQQLRTFSQVPVLMLTGRATHQDAVSGLDSGADDYVRKPVNIEELQARIRALLRRVPQTPQTIEAAGGALHIDRLRREVRVRDRMVDLTPTEYQLLLVLAERAGQVLTHEELLRQVWGEEQIDDNDSLKVYIWHLRRKIEENPRNPQILLTEWGIGYKLAP